MRLQSARLVSWSPWGGGGGAVGSRARARGQSVVRLENRRTVRRSGSGRMGLRQWTGHDSIVQCPLTPTNDHRAVTGFVIDED